MANEGLWAQLIELDAGDAARRAACQYDRDSGCFRIYFLNRQYTVDCAKKQIVCEDGTGASFAEELSILCYLINAKDIPAANKLTPPQSLPDGQFFFRGPHGMPTDKLIEAFGAKPELLLEVGPKFGAQKYDYGDASIRVPALPRVPLTIVVWQGDDEFEARASILLDETAGDQMPLDGLWMVANTTVKALIQSAQS